MSNYTVNILKQMINAGITAKPADCPQELWDEAQIKDAEYSPASETGTAVQVAPSNASFYPSSYGLESFGATSAAINVDAMLKNKAGSFLINGKEILKAPFKAKLLLADTKWKRSIKVEVGGKLQYFSTYGGGVSTDGEPWDVVVAKCKAVNPKAYEYDSGDLVFELMEPLKGVDGKPVADKGQRIGYTTSSTNKGEIMEMKKTCIEKGLDLSKAEVPVEVSFKMRSNANNQTWNIIGLKVLD